MTWKEVKSGIKHLLAERNLKKPSIRLNALDSLERLLRMHMPEVIADPKAVLAQEKRDVIARLEREKWLNGAEKSVLNNVYQVLSGEVSVPASRTSSVRIKTEHKLVPLAECIRRLFEQHFNQSASYSVESQPAWLLSVPDRQIFDPVWTDVSAVYEALVDGRWTLDTRLEEYAGKLKTGQQRVDIWFGAPFNCAVEFDETQHFNQFRCRTLKAWRGYEQCSFDYEQYLALTESVTIPPGTSGFQRLKSYDPLFPPLLEGQAQDNRIRQRAFRDFLKDITPVVEQVNPTIRISYRITSGRIRDFTAEDLEAVAHYVGRFLGKMRLGE